MILYKLLTFLKRSKKYQYRLHQISRSLYWLIVNAQWLMKDAIASPKPTTSFNFTHFA